ncbi:MAG: CPBP family intramembrane metalloprotease [Ruminococcus sp.]|nr:CPBP family intramembrane metalloprotease [Ruminococcus sp.]
MKLKCIVGSILITLSFVLGIGILSSIFMIIFKNGMEHVVLISGIAQTLYLMLATTILKMRKINMQNTYGLRLVSFKEYVLPILAAFCFSAFSNILQSVVPIPQELIGGMSDDMEKSTIAFILSIFIIAPIVEEFVFRALILTKLRKEFSVTASVLICAFMFALIHIMAGGIITVIHAFLGGAIFSLAYVKTKSLFPAIAAHIFGNIGGYITTFTNNLSTTLQYVASIGFFLATIVFCILLIRKKNNQLFLYKK